MRKIVVGGIGIALGVSTVLASGAFAGGNGAQMSPLGEQQGDSSPGGSQCVEGSTGGFGFAIVNAPGKPGEARFVNGEVSLKNGPADSMFTVWLATDEDHCTMSGVLSTNNQGNGNSHIDLAGTSGRYYVVLQDDQMKEAYATHGVTAN